MTQHIQNILSELKTRLTELYGDRLERLVLYGSQARGDAQPDSDIDVLVVLKGEVNPWQEIIRCENIISDIALRYEVHISPMFASCDELSQANEPLFVNVRKEGIPL